MYPVDNVTIIGIVGSTIILVAFLLNQVNKWSSASLMYDVSNAVGSSLLVLYAYLINSYPFMILNTVWFLSAFWDILITVRNKN